MPRPRLQSRSRAIVIPSAVIRVGKSIRAGTSFHGASTSTNTAGKNGIFVGSCAESPPRERDSPSRCAPASVCAGISPHATDGFAKRNAPRSTPRIPRKSSARRLRRFVRSSGLASAPLARCGRERGIERFADPTRRFCTPIWRDCMQGSRASRCLDPFGNFVIAFATSLPPYSRSWYNNNSRTERGKYCRPAIPLNSKAGPRDGAVDWCANMRPQSSGTARRMHFRRCSSFCVGRDKSKSKMWSSRTVSRGGDGAGAKSSSDDPPRDAVGVRSRTKKTP